MIFGPINRALLPRIATHEDRTCWCNPHQGNPGHTQNNQELSISEQCLCSPRLKPSFNPPPPPGGRMPSSNSQLYDIYLGDGLRFLLGTLLYIYVYRSEKNIPPSPFKNSPYLYFCSVCIMCVAIQTWIYPSSFPFLSHIHPFFVHLCIYYPRGEDVVFHV
jgi:hypothetical protein